MTNPLAVDVSVIFSKHRLCNDRSAYTTVFQS